MTRVKVCGITNAEDALRAVDLGADALGFVFYPKSPRNIPPAEAAGIVRQLPPFVASVGVFVDAAYEEIDGILSECGLTAVQLHGCEPPDFCGRFRVKVIKAFRVREGTLPAGIDRYRTDAILLDTFHEALPGGTGETFAWDVAVKAKRFGRLILAGGLKVDNVREAVESVRPYGVDVSSGVESSPGRKDPKKLAAFVTTVKACPDAP